MNVATGNTLQAITGASCESRGYGARGVAIFIIESSLTLRAGFSSKTMGKNTKQN